MINPYGNIFVFFVSGFAFVFLNMALVKLIAPHRPNRQKNMTYECGEEPIGSGWINFNARFYLVAVLFIIFDVEIILVLPVAVNFRDNLMSGNGAGAFSGIFVFVTILFLGLVYAWKNGYLEWIRSVRRQLRVEGRITKVKDILSEDAGGRD